jgi:flagellar motor switch protein FliG
VSALVSPAQAGTLSPAGIRKTAVLLIQLGRERASQVLAKLTESEVEAVTAEIARLQSVEDTESESVLEEFRDTMTARKHMAQGGIDVARQLLESSLGSDRASEIVDRLNAAAVQSPFRFLNAAEPAQLRSFIVDEHPQVIALVLAHMNPDKASLLLAGLDPEKQARVAHRIAVMDRANPEIVRAVEATLEKKISSMLQPTQTDSRIGGLIPLVNILNRADRSTEKQIVAGLESLDATLADDVRSRMFMFEDIVALDDRSVQQVLRGVDQAQLAYALKGVAVPVRDKVLSNMSERAATTLLEEVELLGSVRLAQVEEAQQSVIRTIRQLEEEGQIMVRRGSDDDFVD